MKDIKIELPKLHTFTLKKKLTVSKSERKVILNALSAHSMRQHNLIRELENKNLNGAKRTIINALKQTEDLINKLYENGW